MTREVSPEIASKTQNIEYITDKNGKNKDYKSQDCISLVKRIIVLYIEETRGRRPYRPPLVPMGWGSTRGMGGCFWGVGGYFYFLFFSVLFCPPNINFIYKMQYLYINLYVIPYLIEIL